MATEYSVREQTPTLGDLCDVHLLQTQDPFAAARLLIRWIEPPAKLDQIRELSILEATTLVEQIVGFVRHHSDALASISAKGQAH